MKADLVAKVNVPINKCRHICAGCSINVADIHKHGWRLCPAVWPKCLPWASFVTAIVARLPMAIASGDRVGKRNGAKFPK